ncbi:transposase [Lentzea sp. CC55]|nr:transposase [Lentzea sp. CC55]
MPHDRHQLRAHNCREAAEASGRRGRDGDLAGRRGLTTGEISAHLAEVYGAEVSRQTISTTTDKVIEGMVEWQNRPLDAVCPMIFIDAIHVKIRDGQVANRPIYVARGHLRRTA